MPSSRMSNRVISGVTTTRFVPSSTARTVPQTSVSVKSSEMMVGLLGSGVAWGAGLAAFAGPAHVNASRRQHAGRAHPPRLHRWIHAPRRSEEHTSELQSQFHLVCRLLL